MNDAKTFPQDRRDVEALARPGIFLRIVYMFLIGLRSGLCAGQSRFAHTIKAWFQKNLPVDLTY